MTIKNNKFLNQEIDYKIRLSEVYPLLKAYLTDKRDAAQPKHALPIEPITPEQLISEQEDVVYRIGHSTVLMQLDKQRIITDPIFSQRSSPLQWIGPKRFSATPIALNDMPSLDVVLISHDHYDHLDKATIQLLAATTSLFLVPLKIKAYLLKWGVAADKVIELDWWQSHQHQGITYTLTPTQHFSGRGLFDRDRTLWGSWVIESAARKVFFSGDSGYSRAFKQIGERFGPFDLTLIETGAYNQLWSPIHMFPEQSLQAHLDLQGKAMLPIHNSTFDLALHNWNEPLKRIEQLHRDTVDQQSINLVIPQIGERVVISTLGTQLQSTSHDTAWWHKS